MKLKTVILAKFHNVGTNHRAACAPTWKLKIHEYLHGRINLWRDVSFDWRERIKSRFSQTRSFGFLLLKSEIPSSPLSALFRFGVAGFSGDISQSDAMRERGFSRRDTWQPLPSFSKKEREALVGFFSSAVWRGGERKELLRQIRTKLYKY